LKPIVADKKRKSWTKQV